MTIKVRRKRCVYCGEQITGRRRKYCSEACSKEVGRQSAREAGESMTYRKRRTAALQHKYGITDEDYISLVKVQDGCCAICKRPPVSQNLAVDHDHAHARKHGKRESVRGLLCWSCNYWIVRKGVTSDMLRAAADYLECPPAPAVLGTAGIPAPTRADTPVDDPRVPALIIEDL